MINNKCYQIFSIGVLLAAIVSPGIQGQQQLTLVTDELESAVHALQSPPWNYSKHGLDWANISSGCNASGYHMQSPMNMNVSGTAPTYLDWQKDMFSFVPNFQKTTIKSASTDNYTYTIEIEPFTNGTFQGFWAAEPKHILHKFVKWETQRVQFHYPAEHLWSVLKKNGTNETVTADMEMQIYGSDIQHIATSCKKSGMSGLSLFFFLNETGSEATNKFFEFQTDEFQTDKPLDFDLSLLVDQSTPMHFPVYGYIGSLTQPPCTSNVCWYLLQRAFPITQKQLEYFKVKGVTQNARQAGTGSGYKPLYNKSLFGPNNEIVDPSS